MDKKNNLVYWLNILILSLFLSSCQKKASTSICKTNDDCKTDATGKAQNGICYMGKCEECLENTDCDGLKKCVNMRCVEVTCDENGDCQGQPSERLSNNSQINSCQSLSIVHFDFDKYDILSSYHDGLDELAKCLEKNHEQNLIVSGHADERGTPTYNMALSEKRANAIKDYLTKRRGIASVRIKTVPYGNEKPLLDEKSEYAYSQNRRAEFSLR